MRSGGIFRRRLHPSQMRAGAVSAALLATVAAGEAPILVAAANAGRLADIAAAHYRRTFPHQNSRLDGALLLVGPADGGISDAAIVIAANATRHVDRAAVQSHARYRLHPGIIEQIVVAGHEIGRTPVKVHATYKRDTTAPLRRDPHRITQRHKLPRQYYTIIEDTPDPAEAAIASVRRDPTAAKRRDPLYPRQVTSLAPQLYNVPADVPGSGQDAITTWTRDRTATLYRVTRTQQHTSVHIGLWQFRIETPPEPQIVTYRHPDTAATHPRAWRPVPHTQRLGSELVPTTRYVTLYPPYIIDAPIHVWRIDAYS